MPHANCTTIDQMVMPESTGEIVENGNGVLKVTK